MKPVEFDGANTVFAKDQPEYLPLPAHRTADGMVITCWQFTWFERFKILLFGRMWFSQLTFNQLLQPQRPSVERPFHTEDQPKESQC